jgi:hypothetical protein
LQEDGNLRFNPLLNDVNGDGLPLLLKEFDYDGEGALVHDVYGNLNYTPKADFYGTETFSYTLLDESNNESTATVTLNVLAKNDAPVISGEPLKSIHEDHSYEYIFTATDVDSQGLVYSVTGLPNWMSFDKETGKLSGTPKNSEVGSHGSILVSVSDGELVRSWAPFSIQVVNVNDPPSITGQSVLSTLEDAFYSVTYTGTDIDGDILTYSATGLPSWLTLDSSSGVLSGTPANDSVGVHGPILISVTDGALSSSLVPFSVEVTNVNDGPTISGTPMGTVLKIRYIA